MTLYADKCVGKIVDALEKNKLRRRLSLFIQLIMVLIDHLPILMEKETLWRKGISH